MNWLAHALLSEPDVEFRLGNLLADLVKGRDRDGMPPAFLRGTACHQVIDAFTDSHPLVHRSRARIAEEYGHLTGILVDIFYDHFLARDWDRYCTTPLDTFAASLYADIRAYPLVLPDEARAAVDRMLATDTLGSYRRLEGITGALRRVSQRLTQRLGRPFDLQPAIAELVRNDAGLAEDFAGFFPQLRERVDSWLQTPDC
jgi:acyl carrier protein phosphodiesterase